MSSRPALKALVRDPNGGERIIRPAGRDAWALLELAEAGPKGCTPLDNPAPRWSAYVHKLRRRFGLHIETVHEAHRGAFPGTHARYVLRTPVEIVSTEGLDGWRAVA